MATTGASRNKTPGQWHSSPDAQLDGKSQITMKTCLLLGTEFVMVRPSSIGLTLALVAAAFFLQCVRFYGEGANAVVVLGVCSFLGWDDATAIIEQSFADNCGVASTPNSINPIV
jgi:hypothetical protein